MLPPLRDLPPRKPDEEVKRCTNRQNPRRAALARKHYFEGLVCDLNDPYSEQAKRRKTHRFVGMLQRMHDAREGTAFFHDPPSHGRGHGTKGEGKGQGKGQDKGQVRTQERWTAGLVAAGLDVGPWTDRRVWDQHQQQQEQQQQQPWAAGTWGGTAWGSSTGPGPSGPSPTAGATWWGQPGTWRR